MTTALKIDARYTALSSFAHLGASGDGRLVRAADGVVVGYVVRTFGGSMVRGRGLGLTGYRYSGVDGTFRAADSIDALITKLRLAGITVAA